MRDSNRTAAPRSPWARVARDVAVRHPGHDDELAEIEDRFDCHQRISNVMVGTATARP
jgi:hypothetical protein